VTAAAKMDKEVESEFQTSSDPNVVLGKDGPVVPFVYNPEPQANGADSIT